MTFSDDGKTAGYGSLRELLEARAAATPEKVFLFSESDGRRFTYREFDAGVNRAEYVIAYFACFKLGALAGPVNSLLKPEEMAYVVGNSEAKLLLYNSQFAEQVTEIRARLQDLREAVLFDDEAGATT